MRRITYCLGAVLGLALGGYGPAHAQALAMADRAPRFLLSAPSGPKPVDVSRTAVLRRRIALELRDVTLGEALRTIARRSGIQLGYSRKVVPVERVVRLVAEDITVAGALSEVLFDTGTDVLFERNGQAAIIRRPVEPERQTGAIVGAVTDRATGAPIAGAVVAIPGTRHEASAGEDGRYRIEDVQAGGYTVRARYIGYMPGSASVTVVADQEATADFALEKSAQRLDELVTVTPGGMQTSVRALASPVTVITEEDIQARRPKTFDDVLRQTVPSAVAFDFGGGPAATRFRLRGAATASGSFSTAKIFVDGVEVASGEYAPVDPESIERVEVIRGPQAATVFGPDASGGVIQVYTKRGEGLTRPEISLRSQVGIQQTPYTDFEEVWRHEHAASIRGGLGAASFNLGASWSRLADWVPPADNGTAQSTPSVYGGVGYETPAVGFDVSARYSQPRVGIATEPGLLNAGVPSLAKPNYAEDTFTSQSLGGRLRVTANRWWTHQLTAGVDGLAEEFAGLRPRLTTPADTFVQYFGQRRNRLSIYYNTSARVGLLPTLAATITAGVDYVRAPSEVIFAPQVLSAEGQLAAPDGGDIAVTRELSRNTGYFAQAEIGLREQLFLTLGLRGDENPDFGSDVGTVWSPRLGATYSMAIGTTSLKLRTAYGRAIRGIVPRRSLGLDAGTSVTLPNPFLRPERQSGWDAGFDLFGFGWSLSVTGYDQRARDLQQFLLVTSDPVPTSQWQNIARITNRGVEVEASAAIMGGRLGVRGQYAYTFSRIDSLGAVAAPDSTGDRPSSTPAHTAGGAVNFQVRPGTTLDVGATYVGGFFNSDLVAFFQCLGGTGPCPAGPPTIRAFRRRYPGFVKVNLSISQDITERVSVYVAADNLTNNQAHEFSSFVPVQGRYTAVGLRARL